MVSDEGVAPHPKRFEAIAKFPDPKNVHELRSFLGLANQLGRFAPDLAQVTSELRSLLHKDTSWNWLPQHQEAFERAKAVLTSAPVVRIFDKALKTELLTDASRLHGMGFALIQRDANDRPRLICCGSKAFTETESRYATIKLEMHAATEKCKYFLYGHPGYTLITDHRPLVGIFQKPLEAINNVRLQHMRERMVDYVFQVEWKSGKDHLIADALSRALAFRREGSTRILHVTALGRLLDLAKEDKEYQEVIKVFTDDTPLGNLPKAHPARALGPKWDEISLSQGLLTIDRRIVVPPTARNGILQMMHKSHSGMTKTLQLGRSLNYWPNMNNAIRQMVEQCEICQRLRPAQKKEPLQCTEAKAPLELMCTALFQYASQDFLVLVDWFSGFLFVDRLTRTNTASVTDRLFRWFSDWGFPRVIPSNNGPQYHSEFAAFCDKYNITHHTSSPGHAQSNGCAESAVKQAKYLLEKCGGINKGFLEGLLEHRNTPRANGYSPAELFVGRRRRTQLPAIPAVYRPIDAEKAVRGRLEENSIANTLMNQRIPCPNSGWGNVSGYGIPFQAGGTGRERWWELESTTDHMILILRGVVIVEIANSLNLTPLHHLLNHQKGGLRKEILIHCLAVAAGLQNHKNLRSVVR